MQASVTIVDYGMGNLFSICRALEAIGCSSYAVTNDPKIILNSNKLILPGVGAFGNAITELNERNLTSAILDFTKSGKSMLGICLGMQLLASQSDEFGNHKGLDLIPGNVIAIPADGIGGEIIKKPSVGWASISVNNAVDISSNCLSDVDQQPVYFTHSYYVVPDEGNHVLATYMYGGRPITAAIKKKNITGVQFHPEKSGTTGLKIISNFVYSSD